MSRFGFTYLSRSALRDAEKLMLGDRAGVRDEIGFLIVHQRYADRFFPGTSVLHTRLRYVLFLPWIYEEVRTSRSRAARGSHAIGEAELRLTERLKRAGYEDGVIGGRVYPRATSQPPSYVYWTALSEWGLIRRRPDHRPFSRTEIEHLLIQSHSQRRLHDDDGARLDTVNWPFICKMKRPNEWESDELLSFDLKEEEARYLAGLLRAVRNPINKAEPSLLARLVGRRLGAIDNCWDSQVKIASGNEKNVLIRAGQAAALAAIGRGVYAAQVETLRTFPDGRSTSDYHRSELPKLLARWAPSAVELNDEFLTDMGKLPETVEAVLLQTLTWLRGKKSDPMSLLPVYRAAERYRKGRRARLADTLDGIDRRTEWNNEKHGSAEPLHYRWGNVVRLLRDLEDVE